MTYFLIDPIGNHSNVWLFGRDYPEHGYRIFDAYSDLICANCGKLDERRAIEQGIQRSVRVESAKDARHDLIATDDGQILASTKVWDLADRGVIAGIDLIALPGDERFKLLRPSTVATDMNAAGIEIHPPDDSHGGYPRKETVDHKCVSCGRYYEFCFQPMLCSMQLPEDRRTLFSQNFRYETQRGEITILFCTEEARRNLKLASIKGVDFTEAY